MSALNILMDKVANLHQLNWVENRVICDQSSQDGTRLQLVLQRRFKNGLQRIFLVGIAYKNGELIKNSDLGVHMPDMQGEDTVASFCRCYSYCGMYEAILA